MSVWFPTNDVVSMAGYDRLGLYNMSNNNYRYVHTDKDLFPDNDSARKERCYVRMVSE